MATDESGQTMEMTPVGRIPNLEAQLITQAVQNPEFRQKLLSNPKTVLAEHGLNVPDDVQINVLQESSTQYYLVLPALEASEDITELSDAELEAVAGGANLDSQNRNWTGCASGQSGCVATNGCSVALIVGSLVGGIAVTAGTAIATAGVGVAAGATAGGIVAAACGTGLK